MEPLTISQWATLDRERKELAKAIERGTGLKVKGWTHVQSGCGKPEFDEGLSAPWDRISAIAMGMPLPPLPHAKRTSPVQRKTKKKAPAKKAAKPKRKRGD